MTAPKYDPAELAAAGLTEEEADELREAIAEADRGEAIPAEQAEAEIREELEALAAIEARRAAQPHRMSYALAPRAVRDRRAA